MRLKVIDNILNYVACKLRDSIATDADDNVAVRVEQSTNGKITDSEILCILKNIHNELRILNSYHAEIEDYERTLEDID